MSPGDKCAKGVTAAAKYFRWGGHSGRQEAIPDSCQDGYSDAGVRLELSNKHPRFVPLNSTFIRGSKPQSFVSRNLLVKPGNLQRCTNSVANVFHARFSRCLAKVGHQNFSTGSLWMPSLRTLCCMKRLHRRAPRVQPWASNFHFTAQVAI